MRVLYLINSFVEDGPGMLLFHLLPRLADAGLEVSAAALRRDGPLREPLERAGIACRFARPSPIDPLGVRATRRLLETGRVDALVTSLPRADIVGRQAARDLPSLRLYSLEHGLHAWREKGGLAEMFVRRAYLKSLRRVRTVVCVSDFVREDCRRTFEAGGARDVDLRTIRNGVDTALFAPPEVAERAAACLAARTEFGLPREAMLFGCAGGLRELKGQDVLAEAAAALVHAAAAPGAPPWHFVFAGEGPLRAELERRFAAARVGATFLGAVGHRQMPAFYRALDLYCQPSRMETFGLGVAEALASGVPVVASDIGGLPETLGRAASKANGEAVGAPTPGLLCPPGDPAALADALALLAREPEEQRHRRGAAARRHAVEHLDVAVTAAAWRALLAEA